MVGDMMKEKGFTLVELLGVLIILTIIILVLFPTISTYINNTKEKSFDSEMKIITTSLKNYAEGHKEILPLGEGEYVVLTLGQLKDFGIVNSILKNPLDGKQISDSMEVRITKHNASYTYEVDETSISPRDDDLLSPTITLKGNLLKYYDINDNYTEDGAIARDSNGEILNVEIDKSNINFSKEGIYYVLYTSTDNNNITTYAKRTIIVGSLAMPVSYEDGRAFYYNPVTNSRCKATEAVSTTGTKTGCMKWYAFLTNPESDKVNLILDHNTSTTNVKWTSYNNIKSGPNTALARLKSDVSGWCDEAKTSARMIEAQEIANITKNDKWNNKSTGGHYYYFYDNSQTEYKGAVGTNPYAWLFDNLYGCEAYGCNTSAGASHYLMSGYWTNTGFPDGFPRAWRVLDNGILVHNTANYENGSIRPVISISKKVFELN